MTNTPPSKHATVLIVDDESAIADGYAEWLGDTYRTRTAYRGREALEMLDNDVDVVLLDRRMPEMSGDELLSEIRDRGLSCRVAIVSAVEPDFDIVELGYDAYIEKPVGSPQHLREVVEMMLQRSTYDEQMQRFLSLASKVGTLEAKKSPAELESSDKYASLCAALSEAREQLSATTRELDDDSFRVDFQRRNTADTGLLDAIGDRLEGGRDGESGDAAGPDVEPDHHEERDDGKPPLDSDSGTDRQS